MRQGVTLSLAGIVVGGLLSAMIAGLLGSLMVGVMVSPSPMTFVVVPFALIGLTLGACYVPARRAASMNPAAALRHE